MTDFWTVMSQYWPGEFWSTWAMVIITINYGSILFLFLWGPWVDIPTAEDGTTGHVWSHGNIRESLHKLPVWWLIISTIGFVVAFCYLILYPAYGSSKGILGWTAYEQMMDGLAEDHQKMKPMLDRIESTPILELAKDDQSMRYANRLFEDNCAACHSYDAQGNHVVGAPNLTDNTWQFGGSVKAVHHSIAAGRNGIMPAWSSALTYGEIKNVANYVLSLSGAPHETAAAHAGERVFKTNCVACHGADAEGNQLLGAVNLTDDVWKWGGSLEAVIHTIEHGRKGHMPTWSKRLNKTEIKVLAAWVLSHDNTKEAVAALNK